MPIRKPEPITAPPGQEFTSIPIRTRKETWTDWFPDVEPTLTIDDVVDQVRLIGTDGTDNVTVDKIRFWQREGVLPAPIRRKIGQEKGKARALYPEQAVNAVLLICMMQERGVRLRQLNDLVTRSLTSMAKQPEHDTALTEALTAAAERQQQRVGSPIRQVEVTFVDARDRKHSHVFSLEPKADQNHV